MSLTVGERITVIRVQLLVTKLLVTLKTMVDGHALLTDLWLARCPVRRISFAMVRGY